MDIQTDAMPSAPRPVEDETDGLRDIPDSDGQKEKPEVNTPEPAAEQHTDHCHCTREKPKDTKQREKRKAETIINSTVTNNNQNVNIIGSTGISLSLNTTNVQVMGEIPRSYVPRDAENDVPDYVKDLLQLKKKLTRVHMTIVSVCLDTKAFKKLGKLLEMSKSDIGRIKENFASKGKDEVVFQTLLYWRNSSSNSCSNKKKFSFLCCKLWELQEKGGRDALNMLYKEHLSTTPIGET